MDKIGNWFLVMHKLVPSKLYIVQVLCKFEDSTEMCITLNLKPILYQYSQGYGQMTEPAGQHCW